MTYIKFFTMRTLSPRSCSVSSSTAAAQAPCSSVFPSSSDPKTPAQACSAHCPISRQPSRISCLWSICPARTLLPLWMLWWLVCVCCMSPGSTLACWFARPTRSCPAAKACQSTREGTGTRHSTWHSNGALSVSTCWWADLVCSVPWTSTLGQCVRWCSSEWTCSCSFQPPGCRWCEPPLWAVCSSSPAAHL